MVNRLYLIPAVIIFLGAIGYVLIRDTFDLFTSPEECFVSEMRNWSKSANITTHNDLLLEENDALMISRFRVGFKELDYSKLNEDAQKIYSRSLALFDYCKLDKDIQ